MGRMRSELVYLVALFLLVALAAAAFDRAGVPHAAWLAGLVGAAGSFCARRIARLR